MFPFIETSSFENWKPKYLSDDENAELQQFLLAQPFAGDLVPGSGGVRKLRWKVRGRGKRGGVRIIYYVRFEPNEFWMLTIYAKSRHENVPSHILKKLKEIFENE